MTVLVAECPTCHGYGWALVPAYDRGIECDPVDGPCPDCDGTGESEVP